MPTFIELAVLARFVQAAARTFIKRVKAQAAGTVSKCVPEVGVNEINDLLQHHNQTRLDSRTKIDWTEREMACERVARDGEMQISPANRGHGRRELDGYDQDLGSLASQREFASHWPVRFAP